MTIQLQDKVAVVYGAARSIGSVVARRFAAEGRPAAFLPSDEAGAITGAVTNLTCGAIID